LNAKEQMNQLGKFNAQPLAPAHAGHDADEAGA
jgi:hypothetical protein